MKKILAILLALAMVFSLAACGSDDNLTTNKVLKVADKLEEGKKADNSDFQGYACEENESVYKTYTYTIDDKTSVIVTTDKETGETLEMYLFRGSKYINLKEGKEAVKKFLDEANAEDTIETSKVDPKKRTTTKKSTTTTTTTTQAYKAPATYNTTAASGTTAPSTTAPTTTAPTTTAPSTTAAAATTAAPETTTAAQ